MGKNKSLGYQVYTALQEINLQDIDKRVETFNSINNTNYDYVGKKQFKELKENKDFIFSKRTAENTAEKSKTFITYIKENFGVKMVKDITPEMAISFLNSRQATTQKTISSYKNMLYKVNIAIQIKFNCNGFYNDIVEKYKLVEPEKTNSKRLYTDNDIMSILSYNSLYKEELKFMSVLGCRVHELCNIRVKDIDLNKMTVYIVGKGGRPSYRPILPYEMPFIKSLIKDKDSNERVFKLPLNEKKTRSIIGNEIRKITKELGLPISSKCHEFRKYAAQHYYRYLVEKCNYSVKVAEEKTVSKLLSHGSNREDLKNIYLRS